ncbi:magnesium or manganese-dependent protein phosphatase [Streptomyces subrutilus]|uniref:protein-serine/threonine phosphatase n=2 Tax=Streptomyces subrutilus TaxID=36818 RepID=A0A918QHY4_9ACTN|nr:SpoIIE family protein phosphatase [Streptomyces subrutilus]GGZ49569.1 magnesium or manganese-dependent protein phosphatase [Streptomyces subrutilus]
MAAAEREGPGQGRQSPVTGPGERLALNGMGSFEWDLDAGTLDLDAAGMAVFDLEPEEFDGTPEALGLRLPGADGERLGRSVVAALAAGGETYGGYFTVHRRDGRDQWTHTQGRVLRDADGHPYRIVGIVRDATAELAQAVQLRKLESARAQQTTIVQRTTDALSRAVTVDDVTAALTGAGALERLGADGLALGLVEGGTMKMIAMSGESLEVLGERNLTRMDGSLPLSRAVLTRQARFVTSLSALGEEFPLLRDYLGRIHYSAAAYLPLIAQARAIGGLVLFYRSRTEFSPEERNLCLGLAGIVAQSLQRALLFDQEREFATGLQAAMLPRRIPEITGGEIAVRYHAAWSGREVGGDWYDVISLPRDRVGIVVGDVQGHDTHAAAIMGQLRIALRAYAGEGHPPSTVLARASRFLAELDTERFATCMYAQVDLATGGVRAVRAGHLGPLIRHTDGRTGWPNVRGGLPLGLATLFAQEEFPETRLDLVPGETLVLCTDGLVEEPGTAITQGMEALAHAVRSGPQEAGALADHLSDRLWERWGSGDDVALLVLRRAPDPGTHRAPRIHQYVHQADPEGLSEARYALRQALRDWGVSELADDVELAAGELLVNALLHTDGGAVLTMEVLPEPVRRIRLWVKDRSSVWPRRRTPGEAATTGRGLLLVDAVATHWGVEPRGDGKAVWCEFAAEGRPRSAG